jgi:NAD+ kinase
MADMPELPFRKVALVVHPTREIGGALAAVEDWTERHGLELVQLATEGGSREVAAPGEVSSADLVVALGGDGTVLAALHAAAGTGAPVLGVACGSLGALSAVTAEELAAALDRFRVDDWTARPLPALAIASDDGGDDWAVNDFVVVRRGSGQLAADIAVDGAVYVRLAGDGVIVATPLGSSAYTMAVGGPILAIGTEAFVCTPLAMHGGNAPPLVVPADSTLTVDVHPSYAGFDLEIDGRRRPTSAVRSYRFTLRPEMLRLVRFAGLGFGLNALRRRGLIADSPRIMARDRRGAADQGAPSDSGR